MRNQLELQAVASAGRIQIELRADADGRLGHRSTKHLDARNDSPGANCTSLHRAITIRLSKNAPLDAPTEVHCFNDLGAAAMFRGAGLANLESDLTTGLIPLLVGLVGLFTCVMTSALIDGFTRECLAIDVAR